MKYFNIFHFNGCVSDKIWGSDSMPYSLNRSDALKINLQLTQIFSESLQNNNSLEKGNTFIVSGITNFLSIKIYYPWQENLQYL